MDTQRQNYIYWVCADCSRVVNTELPVYIKCDDSGNVDDSDANSSLVCESCYYKNHEYEPFHSEYAGAYCFCNVIFGKEMTTFRIELSLPCTRRKWIAAVWEAFGRVRLHVTRAKINGAEFDMNSCKKPLEVRPDDRGYCGEAWVVMGQSHVAPTKRSLSSAELG